MQFVNQISLIADQIQGKSGTSVWWSGERRLWQMQVVKNKVACGEWESRAITQRLNFVLPLRIISKSQAITFCNTKISLPEYNLLGWPFICIVQILFFVVLNQVRNGWRHFRQQEQCQLLFLIFSSCGIRPYFLNPMGLTVEGYCKYNLIDLIMYNQISINS